MSLLDPKVKWVGYPRGTFLYAETFLKAMKIPYIIILERACVVHFGDLTDDQRSILEANDWLLTPIVSKVILPKPLAPKPFRR